MPSAERRRPPSVINHSLFLFFHLLFNVYRRTGKSWSDHYFTHSCLLTVLRMAMRCYAMLCDTMQCDARADGLACSGLWLKKAALLYSYPTLIYNLKSINQTYP